jgi:hypothetical protein
MKFYSIHGKLVNVNINQYLIKWDRKVSGPQKKVKDFLFPFWKNDIMLEELRLPGSKLRLDLINLTRKIIIEVSPDKIHTQYNKFMHGSRAGFLKKLKSDAKKLEWAEKSGFKFIELYDKDLENLSKQYIKENFNIDLV